MMGINLENKYEFIINNVITTLKANMYTKEEYEKIIAKALKKDTKSKGKTPIYEDVYNQLLLLLTLSYLIVGIQVNIPSIKTKKTFQDV